MITSCGISWQSATRNFGLMKSLDYFQHIYGHADVMYMRETKLAIKARYESNMCIIFPADEVQDWKKWTETLKTLTSIKKFFAYKIHIETVQE
eukprot:IDg20609t1